MTSGLLLVPASAPRTDWWAARYAGIGASEIAAVLGLSPYTSAFDLYWEKVNVDREVDDSDDEAMYWGRELEDVVARRFAADHPEFTVRRTGLWQSKARPWQLASPDRRLCEGRGRLPVAAWECKTSGSFDGWGDPGTDHIPVHYRAQVLQQLDVLGVDVVYVSLLVNGRSYREYVVKRDEADVELLRQAGDRFWQRVRVGRADLGAADDHAPPVDAHPATTARLRRLHPLVDDTAVTVPPDLIAGRHQAFADRADAQHRLDHCDNRIRELMGDARYAVLDDALRTRVATRIVFDRRTVEVKRLREDHPDLIKGYERVEPQQQLRVPNPKPDDTTRLADAVADQPKEIA